MSEYRKILYLILRKKWGLYATLSLLALVASCLYLTEIGGDLIGGILTEILGICITVFILDVIISYTDERRHYKINHLALSYIKGLIGRLVELIQQQQQSASGTNLASAEWCKLLTPEVAETICNNLDPNGSCRTIYQRPVDWMEHNKIFAEKFTSDLDSLIDKYLVYIPEDIIEKLEATKHSIVFETYRISKTLELRQIRMGQDFQYLGGMTSFYVELFDNCSSIRTMLVKYGIEMPR
jgi:hypothetical protein